MIYEEFVRKNLEAVRARIAEAALRAGRAPSDVQLVAISKTFPVEAVLAAWQAGARDFGENRVGEGERKIPKVKAALPDAHLIWHMVGHIQRRKASRVVENFDVIHSIDRLVLAEKLSLEITNLDMEMEIPALLECNVSGEASKYGFDLAGWEQTPSARDALFADIEAMLDLPGLRLAGLMTMAPIVDDPEEVRPVFASLRSLLDALQERFPQVAWRHLSMGMTDDFEVAVEEGATLVRIGRAIFGERQVN